MTSTPEVQEWLASVVHTAPSRKRTRSSPDDEADSTPREDRMMEVRTSGDEDQSGMDLGGSQNNENQKSDMVDDGEDEAGTVCSRLVLSLE